MIERGVQIEAVMYYLLKIAMVRHVAKGLVLWRVLNKALAMIIYNGTLLPAMKHALQVIVFIGYLHKLVVLIAYPEITLCLGRYLQLTGAAFGIVLKPVAVPHKFNVGNIGPKLAVKGKELVYIL
jgi:hypothetical protein